MHGPASARLLGVQGIRTSCRDPATSSGPFERSDRRLAIDGLCERRRRAAPPERPRRPPLCGSRRANRPVGGVRTVRRHQPRSAVARFAAGSGRAARRRRDPARSCPRSRCRAEPWPSHQLGRPARPIRRCDLPFAIVPPDAGDRRRADLAGVGAILGEMLSARAAAARDINRVRSRLAGAGSPYPSARDAVTDVASMRRYPRAGTELIATLVRRRDPSLAAVGARPRARHRRFRPRPAHLILAGGLAGLAGVAWMSWPDADRRAPAKGRALAGSGSAASGSAAFIADPAELGRAISSMIDASFDAHLARCLEEATDGELSQSRSSSSSTSARTAPCVRRSRPRATPSPPASRRTSDA